MPCYNYRITKLNTKRNTYNDYIRAYGCNLISKFPLMTTVVHTALRTINFLLSKNSTWSKHKPIYATQKIDCGCQCSIIKDFASNFPAKPIRYYAI